MEDERWLDLQPDAKLTRLLWYALPLMTFVAEMTLPFLWH